MQCFKVQDRNSRDLKRPRGLNLPQKTNILSNSRENAVRGKLT